MKVATRTICLYLTLWRLQMMKLIESTIPYAPPMEIFAGKYYTEDGAKYHSTRACETTLSHNLKDLIGIYVETV